jgi:hypothetical protein
MKNSTSHDLESTFDLSKLMADSPAPGFDCGDCTACCTVLAVTELHKPMRRACEHLCRDGCRIYLERPDGCRTFNCLWLRGAVRQLNDSDVSPDDRRTQVALNDLNPNHRPDHSGVIWDYFWETSLNSPCIIAFEVWSDAFQSREVQVALIHAARIARLKMSFRNGDWLEVHSPQELEDQFLKHTSRDSEAV